MALLVFKVEQPGLPWSLSHTGHLEIAKAEVFTSQNGGHDYTQIQKELGWNGRVEAAILTFVNLCECLCAKGHYQIGIFNAAGKHY